MAAFVSITVSRNTASDKRFVEQRNIAENSEIHQVVKLKTKRYVPLKTYLPIFGMIEITFWYFDKQNLKKMARYIYLAKDIVFIFKIFLILSKGLQ